jgi:hypothetical protein
MRLQAAGVVAEPFGPLDRLPLIGRESKRRALEAIFLLAKRTIASALAGATSATGTNRARGD